MSQADLSQDKINEIEKIEYTIVDTVDPHTPETGLARFIKSISDITDRNKRHALYDKVVKSPGLNAEEKAWVKIIRIFDAETKTSEERSQLMSDVAHIAVAEDEKGNPVTTAEVLEHATATPEGMKIFDAIGKMLTRENAERLAPLLAIVYPKAAIYLVGYALRNVPYHAYKAAVADTSEERAEQLRAIFSSAADGLRNSGPLVKPTLWAGLHLPKFLQSIGDLFVKDAIKYGVESFSDKKKWASMREFFESVQNDPKAFLKVFDDLASYFGDTSNTVVTFAAVAIHAKFGSKGTLVLKELAQRGFFEALIKGDTKTADEIKKQVPDGVKVANALEDIRVNEETPDQRAKRDYEEAWLNQLVIPGA